jgi:hypothetical protein
MGNLQTYFCCISTGAGWLACIGLAEILVFEELPVTFQKLFPGFCTFADTSSDSGIFTDASYICSTPHAFPKEFIVSTAFLSLLKSGRLECRQS